jgi:hypothetical protein
LALLELYFIFIYFLAPLRTLGVNTMDLVKFLVKNQNLHFWIVAVTLKVTSYKTMSKKKVKNQDFMCKSNFFLSTLPFNAILATWLHVGAPQKIQEK